MNREEMSNRHNTVTATVATGVNERLQLEAALERATQEAKALSHDLCDSRESGITRQVSYAAQIERLTQRASELGRHLADAMVCTTGVLLHVCWMP